MCAEFRLTVKLRLLLARLMPVTPSASPNLLIMLAGREAVADVGWVRMGGSSKEFRAFLRWQYQRNPATAAMTASPIHTKVGTTFDVVAQKFLLPSTSVTDVLAGGGAVGVRITVKISPSVIVVTEA